MPGRSSGPRRQLKVAMAISRRCSTTIAACPCDAIRCGRCCTIAIVVPRTGRHRRRGFSGGRFPICSRVCCHRSTRCPCQGNVVRPLRQVLEEAGCPVSNVYAAYGSLELSALEYQARRCELILLYADETILWRFALPRAGWWRTAPRVRLPIRPLRQRQITRDEARKRQAWRRYRSWSRSTSGGLLSVLGAVQYGTANVFSKIVPHLADR